MKKVSIILLLVMCVSILNVAAIERTDLIQITVSLEKIQIKLNDLEKSVDSLVHEYSERGNIVKRAAWSKVVDEIKNCQENVDAALKLIQKNDADTELSGKVDAVEESLDDIVNAAVAAATGKEYTGGVSEIKKGSTTPTTIRSSSTGEKVKLDFYVMSQCPYGTQVEDAIKPVLDQMGANIDFNLNFIVTDLGNGRFQSLHGQPEVDGNIWQLCAAKYYPSKYMDFIVCQNKNAKDIQKNWESCAKSNGMDTAKLKECFDGDEGKDLLSESAKKASAVRATGSPTIYLNDQPYSGGRKASDFTRAICNEFTTRPAACDDIPEPTKVNAIILNDKRCKECDMSNLLGQLKGIFPGLTVQSVDYSDDEGKQMFEELNLQVLPAILFDEAVKKDESYSSVASYLISAGDYLSLRIGASFDPTGEICDNGVDDTGNGKTDCADVTCTESLECREEKENHLQVFIMSDCPYGKKAVEALKDVVDNFGNLIDYEVHYIANEAGSGFNSLHGQYEVDENIIQLCVNKHSPEQWMDYIYCRSTKGVKGKDWKDCAEENDVNVEKVETCFDGDEGKALLREDIKIANSLGIGASPTWMANNRYQFSGIDAETVKSQFCSRNQDIEGCENTLSTDTGGVPAGSC